MLTRIGNVGYSIRIVTFPGRLPVPRRGSTANAKKFPSSYGAHRVSSPFPDRTCRLCPQAALHGRCGADPCRFHRNRLRKVPAGGRTGSAGQGKGRWSRERSGTGFPEMGRGPFEGRRRFDEGVQREGMRLPGDRVPRDQRRNRNRGSGCRGNSRIHPGHSGK